MDYTTHEEGIENGALQDEDMEHRARECQTLSEGATQKSEGLLYRRYCKLQANVGSVFRRVYLFEGWITI